MALRILTLCIALSMLALTGCRTRSNYQPACPPAVVAATPVAPSCPPPGVVPPPPGAVIR